MTSNSDMGGDNRPEAIGEFIDYSLYRSPEVVDAPFDSLDELIDYAVDKLPEAPEPPRPRWLPSGGVPIKAFFDTQFSDDGSVQFGPRYTTRQLEVDALNLTFAKNEMPGWSKVLVNVPPELSQFGRIGGRIWLSQTEEGIKKEYEAAVSYSDLMPNTRSVLEPDIVIAGLKGVIDGKTDERFLGWLTTLSNFELEEFYRDEARLRTMRQDFAKRMKAIDEAERRAVVDTQGIILRG